MEYFIQKVYPWLIDISAFIPALPFMVGLYLLRKCGNRYFKLIFLFLVLAVTTEVVAEITVRMNTTNNLWINHVYTPVEFIIVALVYYHSFSTKVIRNGILITAAAFVLLCIGDAVLLDGLTQMNSAAQMIGNALLISLAVLYFYKIANDLTITYLDRDPVFLFSCCILIYKAGTSMSYGMFNAALQESYDAARMVLAIIFILKILFFTGLVLVLKRAAKV
ncbi:hypothetical protein [Pontibacter sp. H249]|uniref:hypothetical protein n=1 Tax=Pontibacter sp. H249 TaxID=3133420 RepID=UPI0030C5F965